MLSKRSLMHLEEVHPDLVSVVHLAADMCENEPFDFILTDGHRTMEEQIEFVKTGKSKTLKSRHLGGFAVDYVGLVRGRVTYDRDVMTAIAEVFKKAARELDIEIEWGGDWKSFVDTPHIQLTNARYPDATALSA